MKKYIKPKVAILVLKSADIITISVLQGNADENDICRFDIGRMFL